MTPTEDAIYSHGHHKSVLRAHEWRTAENSTAYLLPHLTPTTTLLDIGCGPGTITLDFAKILSQSRVIGIDTSKEVIANATELAKERGVANVDFEVADLRALPAYPELQSGGFDIVHCHQVLQHVGDPVGALKAMRAATKEGGVVAAREGDFKGFLWYPQLPGLDEWLTLYLKLTRSNGGEPLAGRHLHAWAAQAGFADEDISCSLGTWLFRTTEERQYWGYMWADRVLESQFAKQTLAKGMAMQEDLERIAKAWRDWTDSKDGWFAVLHGEMIAKKISRN